MSMSISMLEYMYIHRQMHRHTSHGAPGLACRLGAGHRTVSLVPHGWGGMALQHLADVQPASPHSVAASFIWWRMEAAVSWLAFFELNNARWIMRFPIPDDVSV